MSPIDGDRIGLNLSVLGSSDGYSGKPLFTVPHPTLSELQGLPIVHANAGHKKSALTGRNGRQVNSSTQSLVHALPSVNRQSAKFNPANRRR